MRSRATFFQQPDEDFLMASELNEQAGSLKGGSKLSGNPRKPDPRSQPDSQTAPGEANAAPNAWVQERTRVAIGQGVNVAGKLIFNEPIRIEGIFRGEVNSVSLVVISDGGAVEGRVKAARLVVLGELRGDIVGSVRAYLGEHARVFGDIFAENLTVCEGAYFSGNIKMTTSPDESPASA
jgi:cytoskeletal protein CcmA (bactofilin family)